MTMEGDRGVIFQLLRRAYSSRMTAPVRQEELSKAGRGLVGMIPGHQEKGHVSVGLKGAGR